MFSPFLLFVSFDVVSANRCMKIERPLMPIDRCCLSQQRSSKLITRQFMHGGLLQRREISHTIMSLALSSNPCSTAYMRTPTHALTQQASRELAYLHRAS